MFLLLLLPQLHTLPPLLTAGIAPVLPTREGPVWAGGLLAPFLQPDSPLVPPYHGASPQAEISRRDAGHPTDSRSGPAVQSRSPPVLAT